MKTIIRDNHPTFLEHVAGVVGHLNAIYGKGSVSYVQLNLDGSGTFFQTIFGGRGQKRKFRIFSKGNKTTIFCLGHQKTINIY